MKTRRHVLATGLVSLLVLAMSPMPAPIYMNIPAGEAFKRASICLRPFSATAASVSRRAPTRSSSGRWATAPCT